MRNVYLVSCVSEKARTRQPAGDLYRSPWFTKARDYVIRHMKPGDEWFILSAKHYVVPPDQPLDPYNETLVAMTKTHRLDWAKRVLEQLRQLLRPGDTVVMLAGERYREFLETVLRTWGYDVVVPMRGLRIGQQLSWLENELGKK